MDDFPAKLVDLLESLVAKVRPLTVDRVEKIVRISAVALVVLSMAAMATFFLVQLIHRWLAIWFTESGSYLVMAGVFGAVAVFVRRKFKQQAEVSRDSD